MSLIPDLFSMKIKFIEEYMYTQYRVKRMVKRSFHRLGMHMVMSISACIRFFKYTDTCCESGTCGNIVY